jgi:peptidyl-prolyl cis-trans isomerase B (cyclophilin B)
MKKQIVLALLMTAVFTAGCQNKVQTSTNSYGQNNDELKNNNNTSTTMSLQLQPPKAGDTIAIIDTDKGLIKFKLFTDLAPETTKNFIELAKAGKYDGVPFHRVIENFMIQTGDFTNQNGTGGHSYMGPGTSFDDEFSDDLSNIKGAVSMANAGRNTNGSQFFIVTSGSGATYLDNKHSVFGQVFEGQEIAEAISRAERNSQNKPLTPILMKKVTIEKM